jgi:PemK-like, MazF-like toxin of type II toxin-antitoxin system
MTHFDTDSVTLCPLTSDPTDASLFRLRVKPNPTNGLTTGGRLMVDKITTVSRTKLRERVGVLDDFDVVRRNRAMVVSSVSQQARTTSGETRGQHREQIRWSVAGALPRSCRAADLPPFRTQGRRSALARLGHNCGFERVVRRPVVVTRSGWGLGAQVAGDQDLKPTTRCDYESLLQAHVVPRWGSMTLAEVKHEDITRRRIGVRAFSLAGPSGARGAVTDTQAGRSLRATGAQPGRVCSGAARAPRRQAI